MRRTRAAYVVAAAAALSLVATGCSSAGSGGEDDSDVTLTYWASNQGTSIQNDKDVLEPVLEKFTEETGIKVDLEVIGWNDLQSRIQTAVSSGQGPDVVNIGNTWGTSLQSTGAFVEFDDDNADAIGGLDKFVKPALEAGGAPGETPTSVPLYGLAYGLYYNKEMFEDANLDPPETWEDLVSDAKELTGEDQYGISLAAASYTENAHFAFMLAAQNGADYFDSEGAPDFTQKGIVDGVKRYLDLMQTDKVVNLGDAQYDNSTAAINDFANGKSAMVLSQNNAGSSIEANGMENDEFGVVKLPSPADAENEVASHVAGINMSIFEDTDHLPQALKFVKYMTSEDVQAELDKPFSALPVLKDAEVTFTDDEDLAETFTDIYNNYSEPLPRVAAEESFESTVGKGISKEFAKIATGTTISDADITKMLKNAQDSVEAAG